MDPPLSPLEKVLYWDFMNATTKHRQEIAVTQETFKNAGAERAIVGDVKFSEQEHALYRLESDDDHTAWIAYAKRLNENKQAISFTIYEVRPTDIARAVEMYETAYERFSSASSSPRSPKRHRWPSLSSLWGGK